MSNIPRLIALLLLITTSYADLGNVDIAVIVYNRAPPGILPETILSEGYVNNTASVNGDITQFNTQRGIWTWYTAVKSNGGIPLSNNSTNKVMPRLLILNIGTNATTLVSNNALYASRIANGYYESIGYNITVVYPDYHIGSYKLYQDACELSKKCVVMATLLSDTSLYSCTPNAAGVLPADCANKIAGQRRYAYTYCSLQPANYLLYDWIQFISRKNAKTMVTISSPADLIANIPSTIQQGLDVKIQTLFARSWGPGVPTTDLLNSIADDIVKANPDIVNMLCSGSVPQYCYTILSRFKELDWTPQGIMIAAGAMSVLSSPLYPNADYVFGVVPWDRSVSGRVYSAQTSVGNWEPWSSIITNTSSLLTPELFAVAVNRLFPDMLDLQLPIPAIVAEGFLMMQKAVERSNKLLPTADDIRTGVNSLYQPSLLGQMAVDQNGQIVQTSRHIFQSLGSQDVEFVERVDPIFPMKTWGERSDDIVFTINGNVTILSIGICLLCSVVVLFLVEQVTNFHSREEEFQQVLKWLLAAAFIMSINTWTTMIIGVTSIIPQNLVSKYANVTYDPVKTFASILLSIAPNVFSLFILMIGVATRSAVRRERKLSNIDDNSGTFKPTIKSKSSWTGDLVELQTASRISKWWIVLAIVLYQGGIIGTHFIIWSGINISADKSIMASYASIGIIISTLFGSVALWTYFHIRRTRFRILLSFIMAGNVLILHYLCLISTKLVRNTNIVTDGYSSNTLQISASAIGCVMSFIFLAFNVSSMKLSRDVLDVFLTRAQREINQLKYRLDRSIGETKIRDSLMRIIRLSSPMIHVNHPGLKSYMNEIRDIDAKRREVNQNSDGLVLETNIRGSTISLGTKELTLEQILENPVTAEMLKDSSILSHDSENISFLLDVEAYEHESNVEKRIGMAKYIADTYFVEKARVELNIEASLKERYVLALKNPVGDLGFFGKVKDVVAGMVRTNNLKRFITDKPNEYAVCKILISNNITTKPKAEDVKE